MSFGSSNQQALFGWVNDALKDYKTDKAHGLNLNVIALVGYNALKREKITPIFTQPDFYDWVDGQIILNQLSAAKQTSPNVVIKHNKWKNVTEVKTFCDDFTKKHMGEMRRPVGSIMSKVIRILKDQLENTYPTGMDGVSQLNFLWSDKTNIWYFRFKNAVLTPSEASTFCTQIEKHGVSAANNFHSIVPEVKRFIYNRFCRALKSVGDGVTRTVPEEIITFWNSIFATLVKLIKSEEEWDTIEKSALHLDSDKKVVPDKPKDLRARKL